MPWWLLWAALMPVVAWLVRRTPLDGGRWWRAAGVHLVAAPIVASVHLLVEGAVYYYSVSRYLGMVPSLEQQWRNFFANYLMIDVVTYAVIAGAAYAYEFHTSFRTSQLRSAHLELGLAEARMQALRTELNPHFFFNALNAVSGLVRRRENDAAVRMLARLGELLRTTLDRDLAPEIPLREELALLDRYLDIERVRFGDRLRIDVRDGPEVRDAFVPTLLLQPIVENAVRHGVSVQTGPARIEVSAARDGQWLRIVVRNWGRGVLPEAAAGRREGIGLSNTRARLSALYGDRATLALEGLDDGARVTITLPFRRDTETRTEARDVAASA